MTIHIEEEVQPELPFHYKELAEEVIRAALKAEGFPFEAEIGLLLVSLEGIQEINSAQRGLDSPTDVLSFPLIEYRTPGDFSGIGQEADNFNPDTGEVMLGDIVLCTDKVQEQAERFGHSMRREFAFLILHSMLHLFGYDHMEEEEAAIMEEKQHVILGQMGIVRERKFLEGLK